MLFACGKLGSSGEYIIGTPYIIVNLSLYNNNEVFLRVTNHTGQVEKNLLGPAGIRTRDLRFTSPMLYQLSYRSSWGAGRQMMVLGLFDISKQNLVSSISRQ